MSPADALALVKGRDAPGALPARLTAATGRHHTAETILAAWRQGKSANTLRSYQHDLSAFARFFGAALGLPAPLTIDEALGRLCRESSASAHEIMIAFREWLTATLLAPASINRHLATLRSVSKLARMLGLCTWALETPGVKPEKRRDTRGPSVEDVRRMLAATAGDSEAETRDYAIVVTLFCCGLRASELVGLNVEETDLTRGTAWIRGKGRREKELIPLPAPVVEALRRYLAHRRGPARGPLLLTRGQRGRAGDGRLETRSALRIVRGLGARVGLRVWPHALRHAAITAAIEHGQRAGLGLDQIRAFSRHRALTTMLVYRDEHDRATTQRTLADLVAATLQ